MRAREQPQARAWAVGMLLVAGCWIVAGFGAALAVPPGNDARQARLQVSDQPPDTLPLPKELQLPSIKGGGGSIFDAAKQPEVNLAVMPIDFGTALRLAQTNNLEIAQARQFVNLMEAGLLRAEVLTFPNANGGSVYLDHTGRIQQAIGNIVFTNRQSLWVGGGPGVNFQFNEAIFAPLAARQQVAAAEQGVGRVTLATFLDVAEAYFNVMLARRKLALVDETLDFLTADTPSPKRGDAKGLYPLVRDFVKAGRAEALKADEARVLVEVFRRQEDRRKALQDFEVASAGLARVLYLDPRVFLWPVEDFRFPMPLPGQAWMMADLDQLVQAAASNRPDLAENQALIRAMLNRWRMAKFRPFSPSFIVNFNAGGFGGGPNFLERLPGSGLAKSSAGPQTNSGYIQEFGGRTDFDAALVWRLQNLGFGNLAEIRETRTLYNQSEIRQMQILELVMMQVVQAKEQVEGSRARLDITRSALFDEKGEAGGPVFESLRLNFSRIRNVAGARPLEVQNAIVQLYDLLDKYASAATDFERSRFRLLIALGLPPGSLFDPAAMPQPGGLAPALDDNQQRRIDALKE